MLKEIGERLESFIEQRNDVALILHSPAADSLPILKILEGLEEASASDLFWIFTDNFAAPQTYVNDVVRGFAMKHELVRLAMAKNGMPPWPPIPAEVLNESVPPSHRLRELGAFSRTFLPVPNGGNNVWIFYPLEVSDQSAYIGLMEELLRHEFPFPWCHHLRFIIREDPADGERETAFATAPRRQRYQPDLSMAAIERGLEAEVADESLPLPERLAPLPIMAGNDFALERYPEAMKKYELLFRYHASMNNHTMAAFALNGMGEVYEKMGDFGRANESYEAALIPASQSDPPPIPIFLNIVANLGNLCERQGRWQNAEAYFDMAQQLATAARNPPAKISSLEKRGCCQRRQGKIEEALSSWNDGVIIAAQLQDVHSCRAILGRIEQHYTETQQAARAHELQEQLAALAAP